MRTSTWVLVAAAAISAVAFGPPGRAARPPQLLDTEGPLVGASVDVELGEYVPVGSQMYLVQSGVPGAVAQRVRMRLLEESRQPDSGSFIGIATQRLVADRVYDVIVRYRRQNLVHLRSAFTARAPRLFELRTAAAARGEVAVATIEFASRGTRFRVGSMPARIVGSGYQDEFSIEVPVDLPREITRASVTVSTAGRRLTASAPLKILRRRRVMEAVADGALRTTNDLGYTVNANGLDISGTRRVAVEGGTERDLFIIDLPVDLASLTLPATFTRDDGGVVWWANGLGGPKGLFRSTELTVTLESLEGSRLTGTFSAHVREYEQLEPLQILREFDVTDGRFEVDPW